MNRNNANEDIRPEPLSAEDEQAAPDERSKQEVIRPENSAESETHATADRDALIDRIARMQAEFENARKRAAKEQQQFRSFALADALKSLLPVLDSFDRALQAPTQNLDELRNGVELIRKQFHDAMRKLGVSPVAAKGEEFDPLLHEAVDTVDSPDTKDNHVVEELQRGYKLGSRLLRPASVRVARNRESS
jgi:molecular chaperone GrpE